MISVRKDHTISRLAVDGINAISMNTQGEVIVKVGDCVGEVISK